MSSSSKPPEAPVSDALSAALDAALEGASVQHNLADALDAFSAAKENTGQDHEAARLAAQHARQNQAAQKTEDALDALFANAELPSGGKGS